MEIDLSKRLTGIKIVHRNFKDEETGRPVNYRQIVLVGILNGNEKEVPLLKVAQAQIDLVEAFSEKEPNFQS